MSPGAAELVFSPGKRLGPACLLLTAALACSQATETGTEVAAEGSAIAAPAEARLAPDFELQSLTGGVVRLSELRGKTVLIDFWATWCPPCEFQVPELNTFFEAHRADDDVAVLGISVDVEGPEIVSTWVGDKGVKYEILLGGEDLARRFGALGFPTLYIIAPDGRVDSEHVGLIEVGDLEAALARIRGATLAEGSSGDSPG